MESDKKELSGKFSKQIETKSNRSRVVAGLLAIFLGGLGIHKFYLGKPIQGVIYLVFSWTTIPMIIAFIEGFYYFFMSDKSFESKYS